MAKLLAWGFQELLPENQIILNNINDIISKNYKKFGYVNIETPAVELNEVLTSKWGDEVSKQIFGLYGLKQGWEDLKQYSLHFDLTVPLARYVVDNENELKFPFKRYQIQKVWRGERQQKWRFKEFTQADIDVIWSNLSLNYDSEVILTLYSALKDIFEFLNIEKKAEVHFNNKKFIEWICVKYSILDENRLKFFNLLDNFYKIEATLFDEKLKEIVWDNFLDISTILKTQIMDLDDTQSGVIELKQVYNSLKNKWVNVVFDPYITRGLDYYTGTVFETFIENFMNFWSICSGWRYDNLVNDVRSVANGWKVVTAAKNYMWVWGSIGLSRLFARLFEGGFIDVKLPLADAIIFNTWWITDFAWEIADLLRNNWISTDIYYDDEKLGKQFTYAESKNITFWIFAWEEEQKNSEVVVKNLLLRTQENVAVSDLIEYLKR